MVSIIVMKGDKQLRTNQLKTRQLSLKYLQLEQSGENLNYLIRFDPKRLNHKPLEFQSIDLREVFTLMVQCVYLIFNATLKNLNLRLSKSILISRVSFHHFTIHKMYLLDQHYFQLNSQLQTYVQKYFDYYPVSNNNVFQSQVMGIIYSCLSAIKRYSQKYPEFINKVYKQHFEQFCFILNELIRPNLPNIRNPIKLVQCCQKSQVFRDNSLLLMIKSNLLYDEIRKYIEQGRLFEKLQDMQKQLLLQMNKCKTCKDTGKAIKQWIQNIMLLLIEVKVIFSELSLDNENSKKRESTKQEKQIRSRWEIYTKQKRQSNINKLNFQTLLNSNQNLLISDQSDPDAKFFKKNPFIVEYDSRREVITLKMVTNLAFTIQSSDLLTYQASLAGSSWEFPTIQMLQSRSQNDRKQKWLAVSSFFRIMPSQHPTTQMLLLMDMLMVHSKIISLQLNQPPYKRNLPDKLNLSQQSSQHIHALLLANIKKVYDIQLDDSPE